MNNRELATFIILGAGFIAAVVFIKDFRRGIPALARTLVGPVIAIPLAIFTAATVGAVLLARALGLWTTQLTAAAILWFLFVGFAWFVNLSDAGKDDDFFKRRLLEAIGIGAFFEFFINAEVMSIWVELPAQVLLMVVVLLNAFASREDQYKPVVTLTSTILIVSTLGLFAYTVVQLIADWPDLDRGALLDELLMPIWLTLTAILVLYPVALYMGYDSLYRLLRDFNDGKHPSLHALAGVAVELRGSLVDINQFRGMPAREAARAASVEGARTEVRLFKQERADDPLPVRMC